MDGEIEAPVDELEASDADVEGDDAQILATLREPTQRLTACS